ncbi:hypothetical protein RDABS01_032348 [Bienertia sinuspersici]
MVFVYNSYSIPPSFSSYSSYSSP